MVPEELNEPDMPELEVLRLMLRAARYWGGGGLMRGDTEIEERAQTFALMAPFDVVNVAS
jgi:hypothetical protein